MTIEVWRSIPEWPEYEASSRGRIRRSERYRSRGVLHGASIKTWMSGGNKQRGGTGYCMISLWRNNRCWRRYVHRLVASAFYGPPNGREVNHKDGNHRNNAADNLEWVTRQENYRHATGVLGTSKMVAGSRNINAILTEPLVHAIRAAREAGITAREISKIIGCAQSTIYAVGSRSTWKHVD